MKYAVNENELKLHAVFNKNASKWIIFKINFLLNSMNMPKPSSHTMHMNSKL